MYMRLNNACRDSATRENPVLTFMTRPVLAALYIHRATIGRNAAMLPVAMLLESSGTDAVLVVQLSSHEHSTAK